MTPVVSKQIVVQRFLHLPHRGAAMFGKTIQGAEFGQRPQFIF
jgi:hypothetical protein